MKLALQRLKSLTVLLATPSTGIWTEEYGKSLSNLTLAFNTHRVGSYRSQSLHVMSIKGSILPNMRLSALERAKELDADYLLFVDSDQSFPRSTAHKLIARNLDVVGCNIATKTIPTMPTASKKAETPSGWGPVFTDEDSRGVERVDRIGCGILLLSRKVIRALPPDCFEMVYIPAAKKYQGEDWKMCAEIEKLGFEIHIDHDLSKEIGHHGTFNFTHEYNGEVIHGSENDGEGKSEEGDGDVRLRAGQLRAEPLPGSEGQGRDADQGAEGRRQGADSTRGDSDRPVAAGAA